MSSLPKSPFGQAFDRLSWYLPDVLNGVISAALNGAGDPARAAEWLAEEFVPESMEPDQAVVVAGLVDLAGRRAGEPAGGGR